MTEDVSSQNIVSVRPPQHPVARWDHSELAPAVPKPSFERPMAAIRRYKLLILGIMLIAVVAGFAATRFLHPQYEVRATIWIEPSMQSDFAGPIRSPGLLSSTAWVELVRSYRIVDAVVRKLALYVEPENSPDSWIFANFAIADRFVPGKYLLKVDRTRKRWQLVLDNGALPDSGAMGDSVGRRAGLRWVIPAVVFGGSGKRQINFTVSTPREAAVDLMKRLNADLPDKSNFLWLRLRGENPQLDQRTLNTWMKEYVDVASQLKRRNVVQFATIL